MTLREALAAIYEQHGRLTPDLVVREARGNRSSAGKFLHARLEWDDAEAGEAHRRAQAQELIRSVRVVYREATEDEEARSVRAFHSVRRPEGYGYEPLDVITRDPLTAAMVLRDAEREWRALHRRYAHLREFVEMVQRDVEAA